MLLLCTFAAIASPLARLHEAAVVLRRYEAGCAVDQRTCDAVAHARKSKIVERRTKIATREVCGGSGTCAAVEAELRVDETELAASSPLRASRRSAAALSVSHDATRAPMVTTPWSMAWTCFFVSAAGILMWRSSQSSSGGGVSPPGGGGGVRLVPVPGDGNCLYHAVVAQLQGHGERLSVEELRELVEYELLNNRDDYKEFLVGDGTYKERVSAIVQSGAWATELGDMVPKAIANALERPILVLSVSGEGTAWSPFHPRSGRTASPVYLHVDLERNHYSIVQPSNALRMWLRARYRL